MVTLGPTEAEAKVLREHFVHLDQLVSQGTVLMAGRTLNNDERTFGMVIFVASSVAEAERIVNEDPAVRGGVMRAELFPYRIALWSPKGPSER